MTKLIVASDSHGSADALKRVLDAERDASALIYLGDGLRDLDEAQELFPGLRVYRVRGNCDLGALDPDFGAIPVEGVLVFYTHGHLYGVKSSLERLARTALARGATIALYGHTHRPAREDWLEITLFNPGSVGRGEGGPCSYGVLTIQDGKAEFVHKKVPQLWD